MSGPFRCWLPSDARPETPNVTALNAAFAAQHFVERDVPLDDGVETLVTVEDAVGRVWPFTVGLEVTWRFVVRMARPEPAPAIALEELHSDELAEGAS